MNTEQGEFLAGAIAGLIILFLAVVVRVVIVKWPRPTARTCVRHPAYRVDLQDAAGSPCLMCHWETNDLALVRAESEEIISGLFAMHGCPVQTFKPLIKELAEGHAEVISTLRLKLAVAEAKAQMQEPRHE
jgi:hypothetical protein